MPAERGQKGVGQIDTFDEASTHRWFVHYSEPWELTTVNGRQIAASLGEVEGNATVGELAYLAVEDGHLASTLLTAAELTALIDQLTIVRNAMGDLG